MASRRQDTFASEYVFVDHGISLTGSIVLDEWVGDAYGPYAARTCHPTQPEGQSSTLAAEGRLFVRARERMD